MSWTDGIEYELQFWDRWFTNKGKPWAEDYTRRMDPNREVWPEFIPLIDSIPANPVRILDVGAGPITIFGLTHPRKKIELQATDALAREYDTILLKHGITPAVRTMQAAAEKLTDYFAAGMFDFVHARNSIDHCAAPHQTICQMLAVAKIGAKVSLNHAENEAENEKYVGFHQWNFTVEGGEFIIRGRGQTFNISEMVSPVAKTEAVLDKKWVTVTLEKTKDLTPDGTVPKA
jgi:SAM-dependent methyltransferase